MNATQRRRLPTTISLSLKFIPAVINGTQRVIRMLPFGVWGLTVPVLSQLTSFTYDYIIVGGGTAGLTLASRLASQNSSITVLVIEAGPTDSGLVDVEAPFLATSLTPGTVHDWNYTVIAQTGLNSRTFSYPRGRLLGGSSSINFMFHQYGSADDWNRIASVSGDPGWSWSNMRQFVMLHEKIVPPTDNHNTSGQLITSIHGQNGTVSISLPGTNQTIDSRILATTRQLAEFPFNADVGGGDQSLLGIGFLQSSIGGGLRSSSSTTYLRTTNTLPNLTVLINTTVLKLLQTTAVNPLFKAFRSVQVTPSIPDANVSSVGTLPITVIRAKKDVILSSGAVGTPQLLQVSGIGNATDLEALGITPIIDNPSVGSNLADHLFLSNVYSVNSNTTLDPILRNSTQFQAILTGWLTNKTGVMTNTLANNLGFLRFPANSTIFQTVPDPSAGVNSPHWEIIFSNFFFNPGVSLPITGSFMTIPVVLVSPLSRGTIKIRSNNTLDKPIINPNFLTNSFDIFAMREAVSAVQRFVAAPAWSDYVIGPFGASFIAATTSAAIDSYVRSLATGIFHPVGTAAISASTATTGVVQANLTVKGTEGLRVVDASVFPFPFSSHPQGSIYLLAERAAVIIEQANS